MGRETVEVPVKIIEEILNSPIQYKIKDSRIVPSQITSCGNYTAGYFVNMYFADYLEKLLSSRGGE